MLSNLKKYQLILASNSPRRKELMSGLGVEYVVRTLPDVDESYPETLVGAAIPEYISREKADAYRSMMKPGELLITADTIVWLEGKVLGKPEGREGAVEMLRALSGKSHQVFTGVCLTTTEWQKSFAEFAARNGGEQFGSFFAATCAWQKTLHGSFRCAV